MHRRGPVVRVLVGVALICAAVLVVAGGVALRGPSLIAIAAGGVLAGCLAAGMAKEQPGRSPWAMADTAAMAAGLTTGGLLALCGAAALFGGGPTAVVTVLGGAVVAVVLLHRLTRTPGPGSAPRASAGPVLSAWADSFGGTAAHSPHRDAPRLLPPVDLLTTRALGREWLRTTAALAGRLEPVVRACLVQRREDALDELERRDPAGFARWLADGPQPGSDPADWVRIDSAGSPEAA